MNQIWCSAAADDDDDDLFAEFDVDMDMDHEPTPSVKARIETSDKTDEMDTDSATAPGQSVEGSMAVRMSTDKNHEASDNYMQEVPDKIPASGRAC